MYVVIFGWLHAMAAVPSHPTTSSERAGNVLGFREGLLIIMMNYYDDKKYKSSASIILNPIPKII